MLAIVIPGVFLGEGPADMCRLGELVPHEICGWRGDGQDATYDRETVFQYIDGAAEVYLTYPFRQVFVRRFAKAGAKPLVAEVYDMGSSADAYGIFSFEREEEKQGIGQGYEYAAGWLRLWRGPYYVSVLCQPETPEGREAVMALGSSIAEAIPATGPPPAVLGFLPPSGLLPNTVRYFHSHHCLNYHYFVADQNILELGPKTECVLARYQQEGGKPHLLLVRYPSAETAAAALRSFLKAYLPEGRQSGSARLENGKWAGARARQECVAVVLDAPSRKQAAALLDATLDRSEERKQ